MSKGFVDKRLRGVRLVELAALACLGALILWVYVAKAAGADERAAIQRIERDIAHEQARIRLLSAEAARLERPERLERLSATYLEMAPADPAREAEVDRLDALAGEAPVAPAPVAPAPVAPAPAAPAVAAPVAPAAEAQQ